MANFELTQALATEAFLLIYAILLLLLSLVLTFAGSFLTLDRTRSFAPADDVYPKPNFIRSLFNGGVGGLITGFTFGLHLSTFLSLLIPSVSSSKPLSSGAFLAVWLLSSVFVTGFAGRWKYVALTLAGISGGSTLALSVSVIIHPSLIARVILVIVFLFIFTIFVLLPIRRCQRGFIRTAMSASGSFGVILSIALLAKAPAWSNVWERLWVSDSINWGTPQERGLSAGFCLFLCAGAACDWFLKFHFGENPDKKWDSYLSKYVAGLPDTADRAGSFQPLTSIWSKLFGKSHTTSFPPPPYEDIKIDFSDAKSLMSGDTMLEKDPGLFRKHKKHSATKESSRGVKFRPLDFDDLSSDSDSDSEDVKTRIPLDSPSTAHTVPWLTSRPSFSFRSTGSTTLFGDDSKVDGARKTDSIAKEKAQLFAMRKSMYNSHNLESPDYSDVEEDVTTNAKISRDDPRWTPAFLRRDSPSSKGSRDLESAKAPSGAVPVTPSLIKALDRIAVAQGQAYGSESMVRDGLPPTSANRETERPQWDTFWKDVNDKANQQPPR